MTVNAGHYGTRLRTPKADEEADRAYAQSVIKQHMRTKTVQDVATLFEMPVAYVYQALSRYELSGGQPCPMWAVLQIKERSMR